MNKINKNKKKKKNACTFQQKVYVHKAITVKPYEYK